MRVVYTLWDGVWWSVVTVTTVGYGDLYPTSVQGRLIGIVLMFTGIGFLSLLTAAIASRFVRQDAEVELGDVMEVPEVGPGCGEVTSGCRRPRPGVPTNRHHRVSDTRWGRLYLPIRRSRASSAATPKHSRASELVAPNLKGREGPS